MHTSGVFFVTMQRACRGIRLGGRGFVFALSLAVAGPLFAAAPPVFARTEDPVVMEGRRLEPLLGKNIDSLELFSFRGNEISAIPFQVDRKDADSGYIFKQIRRRETEAYQTNPDWVKHGKLQDSDEMVFLARDMGERNQCQRPGLEIEAKDPRTGAVAYAYLFSRATGDPVLSAHRYVTYDSVRNFIHSSGISYGPADPEHPAVFNRLTLGEGGDGATNLLERFQSEFTAGVFFGCSTVHRREDDVQIRTLGYTEGPVRALLKQESRVYMFAGLDSGWVERVLVNYDNRIEIPTRFHVPFRLGRMFRHISVSGALQFTDATLGARLSHPALKEPQKISRDLPRFEGPIGEGEELRCALAGEFGGLVAIFRGDERVLNTEGVKRVFASSGASTYTAAEKKRSTDRAVARAEMRLEGLEYVPRGDYDFRFILFARKAFKPGDEREFFQIESEPLRTTVRDTAGRPVQRADTRAAPTTATR